MICAFIANAASFVLPISNPANLVVYREHMPPPGVWIAMFGLASVLAIAPACAAAVIAESQAFSFDQARLKRTGAHGMHNTR
jgi:arsenical pump membrane protein